MEGEYESEESVGALGHDELDQADPKPGGALSMRPNGRNDASTEVSMSRYWRSSPIMAYPQGRVLRQCEPGERLDVWAAGGWEPTSSYSPPSNATEISASEAEKETA